MEPIAQRTIDPTDELIQKLEMQKTDLLAKMEQIHQVDLKLMTDPDTKFAKQEVPKMQLIERYRTQLIQVEKELKLLKSLE